MEVFRSLYDGFTRHRFLYDYEVVTDSLNRQAIRKPIDIVTHGCATCIDLACLFASFLEAAHQRPVVVVLDQDGAAHALAGYRAINEPASESPFGIGDLRRALSTGDFVLFECTGAVIANRPVAGESEKDRLAGGNMLDFIAAKTAAQNFLARDGVKVRFVVDVRAIRERAG